MTIWFWDASFHTETISTITEGSNAHWCFRRKNHALRAGAWKLLNWMEMCKFFLFCLNIIFFHLVLPFRSYKRCMFPRRQNKLNWPWSSNSKSFHAPALNAWFFLLEHQWVFEPSVIVVYESLSVKRCISKSYSHCWKGFKYAKMLENQRICGSWRIFLKNSSSLTVQDKQGTHEQLSLNAHTQLWIIQLTTQY